MKTISFLELLMVVFICAAIFIPGTVLFMLERERAMANAQPPFRRDLIRVTNVTTTGIISKGK